MQGNRARDTRPEKSVRSALHRRGIRFRVNRRPVPAIRCSADIVFPTERVAVFIDGCFWHACPEHGVRPRTNADYWDAKLQGNVDRDSRNNTALREAGWTVLRFWEHEDPDGVAATITDQLKDRRASDSGAGPT